MQPTQKRDKEENYFLVYFFSCIGPREYKLDGCKTSHFFMQPYTNMSLIRGVQTSTEGISSISCTLMAKGRVFPFSYSYPSVQSILSFSVISLLSGGVDTHLACTIGTCSFSSSMLCTSPILPDEFKYIVPLYIHSSLS